MDQFDNLNKFVWKLIKLVDKKSFEQLFKCLNNLAKNSSLQNFQFKIDNENIKIGIGILNRWLYVAKGYIKYKKVSEEAKH